MSGYMPKAKSVEWYTPPEVFKPWHDMFRLTLDVCAKDARAAKLPKFFTPQQDGLAQDWTGERCWMNPPFGRGIERWVAKAVHHKVVALLPARTDTRWFHEYVYGIAEIRFLPGRIRFLNEQLEQMDPAPFPCMIAVWNME